MDKIIDEIKTNFAVGMRGFLPLKGMDFGPAYTYRQDGEFGLAIIYDSEKDMYEEANEVILYTTLLYIENSEPHKYLMLACSNEQYRNKFAELSRDFIDPGINGEKREKLLSDPIKWWNSWIGLLGDRKSNKKSYDTIAEMIALDYLYTNDKTTEWKASEAGTHDIETKTESFEIKSTVKKTETTVSISSQHQLDSSNQLYLVFIRMEKSLSGFSINDIAASLKSHGYDEGLIESQLEERGFRKGSSIRDLKYAVLDIRIFTVDDDFPKIVKNSFKHDVFPKNVIKILYTINLEGLNYSSVRIHSDCRNKNSIQYEKLVNEDKSYMMYEYSIPRDNDKDMKVKTKVSLLKGMNVEKRDYKDQDLTFEEDDSVMAAESFDENMMSD